MFKIILFVSSCFMMSLSLFSQPSVQAIVHLKKAIEAEIALTKGNFAVVFHSVSKPELGLTVHEKEIFHAASTMKTPVMIEVFNQVEEGKFKLSDSILVQNSFKSIVDGSPYQLNILDDSADGMYERIGEKMTVWQLVYEMITVSSNLATNILIEKVGASNVMNTMHKLGAKDIRVLRGVEDQKAFDKGWNNVVTAFDLALIFEKLARGQVVSREASNEMIQILKEQKFNSIIPALLPKEVQVAHKTGEITGVRHDTGIVYLPSGEKYVLVLLSKNLENQKAGEETMAKISKMVYQFVINQGK